MLRRALRRAFTVLSALSLLLCVAVCVLWVRSYRKSFPDVLALPASDPAFNANSWRGNFNIWKAGGGAGQYVTVSHYSFAGVGYARYRAIDGSLPWGLTIPHWMLTTTTALPVLLALLRKSFRRKSVCGHVCATCGYDLRASPERCPECGTVVKTRA